MKHRSRTNTVRLTAVMLALTLLLPLALSGCARQSHPAAAPAPAGPTQSADPTQPADPAPGGDGPSAVQLRYAVEGNSLQDFDLGFLQLEDKAENMIFSPLSIKYALGMLNEGTGGETHAQIAGLIGAYSPRTYRNSAHLSFANAMFIRDSFESSVKPSYLDTLTAKYGAEVRFDPFTAAEPINGWVKDKTLGLIGNLVKDDDVTALDFALINALAIDMEWNEKFLDNTFSVDFAHENYWQSFPEFVMKANFADMDEQISGMRLAATVNNYDIVRELGEDQIRETVGKAFDEFMRENPDSWYLQGEGSYEEKKAAYLDTYIEEIGRNYHVTDSNTEFSFYVDDDVKVFGKDLKAYDGVKLRYVAIMPQSGDLAGYLHTADAGKINRTLGRLKTVRTENFREGVVTRITGFMPKFHFEYSLDLMEDLKKMGVTDVFDASKADLSGITDAPAVISSALHKATIEFTQDGIKASAATMIGGCGAGSDFDYCYDVPVEEIDLTFDKPFLFFIQDQDSGEVWFAGTVYEPLKWSEEPQSQSEYGYAGEYSFENFRWKTGS